MKTMSLTARRELVVSIRQKYHEEDWIEKGKILTGFVAASGYDRKYAILLLNKEECNEVNRAMSEDKETVHNVQMKDIYRCVMTPEETIPAEIRNKVEPWVGRMYFTVTHPTTGVRMMYTPMTSTRLHFEREDASKILVTCVPNGANVKMIEPQDVEKFDVDRPE